MLVNTIQTSWTSRLTLQHRLIWFQSSLLFHPTIILFLSVLLSNPHSTSLSSPTLILIISPFSSLTPWFYFSLVSTSPLFLLLFRLLSPTCILLSFVKIGKAPRAQSHKTLHADVLADVFRVQAASWHLFAFFASVSWGSFQGYTWSQGVPLTVLCDSKDVGWHWVYLLWVPRWNLHW